ncbi:hypothetical protein [Myxococcus llanfairpwllgwyngyllgogerychwyrndrobwllllantysiliogogogochensis]|uniref:hypothetical protein n=1 Tax=Myxococcus llanfairpwllgwyngyllgogerychwyrndrobwllllantysiliogogogochensis TaxID=2590453 RepID=UPI0015F024FF|nr:hypothetical protein [Myxococcus llanfairpwllgwyngyllgogerychwyrndrobwllllantysiliogogogochensis]
MSKTRQAGCACFAAGYRTPSHPEFSFVDVAKSLGVPHDQVIHRRDEMKAAPKVAVEHVLTRHEP